MVCIWPAACQDEPEVSMVRSAVQQILTNRVCEFAQEVQGSNSLVVVGLGPTVAAVAELAQSLDRPLPEKIQKRKDAQRARTGR